MATGNAELYERDFFEWTQATAAALRNGDLAAIAREAAAEEIEDMGKNHLSAVLSRATVLITHMLKWQFQADRRSRSWLLTITVQRQDIGRLLDQSPSLRRKLRESFEAVYRDAVRLAMIETNLFENDFPSSCPWTFEQVLDPDFTLPE